LIHLQDTPPALAQRAQRIEATSPLTSRGA